MSDTTPAAAAKMKSQAAPDQLEGWWYLLIWGSVLLAPMGTTILIVILSSVMYYVWRDEHPAKARKINLHGWLAFFTAIVVWPILFCGFVMFVGALLPPPETFPQGAP